MFSLSLPLPFFTVFLLVVVCWSEQFVSSSTPSSTHTPLNSMVWRIEWGCSSVDARNLSLSRPPSHFCEQGKKFKTAVCMDNSPASKDFKDSVCMCVSSGSRLLTWSVDQDQAWKAGGGWQTGRDSVKLLWHKPCFHPGAWKRHKHTLTPLLYKWPKDRFFSWL